MVTLSIGHTCWATELLYMNAKILISANLIICLVNVNLFGVSTPPFASKKTRLHFDFNCSCI